MFAYMIQRRLETKVKDALKRSSSVAILGPRQVGKTTTALDIAETTPSVYLDLENRLDLAKARDMSSASMNKTGKACLFWMRFKGYPRFLLRLEIMNEERRKGNKTGQFLFPRLRFY